MRSLRRLILLFFLALCLAGVSGNALASFNKNLWPIWLVNNPLSQETISHDDWQDFLDAHVSTSDEGINLIDYSDLKKADLDLLSRYINKLSTIDIRHYNRSEQLAYWINLYNAQTVRTVANYYPISSVEQINISPGLFSVGPWGAQLLTVNGHSMSLDDIQNRIIRPIWNDPRTHYALNNACIGAANLSRKAWRGDTIETQLNQAASRYINSFRGVQVIEGKLVVSKIYNWFVDDFGGSQKDVITHLRFFARQPLLNQLQHINGIDNYVYNWHLNNTLEPEND
ncbi:DUF547 domain-containing protein [Legionella sp. CNM-4043-24]|uniref:DUF547 domain-containing protein n=1 Tax=Legionella sp. CNM-4043-24 TaxID=3421646 RepID=UPI00403A830E